MDRKATSILSLVMPLSTGVLILLMAGWCGAVRAADTLEWKARAIQTTAEAGQEKVVAEFSFSNASSHDVTITNLISSCSCTVADLARKTYAPGESGTITVTFFLGERTGTQVKIVTVETDQKNVQPTDLVLTVEISQPLSITPRLVHWAVGQRAESRRVQIAAPEGQTIRVTDVRFDRRLFSAEIKVIQADRNYQLEITPRNTAKAVDATIEVRVQDAAGRTRQYPVMARIIAAGAGKRTDK